MSKLEIRRSRMIRQAASSAVERLEQRVLLSAGKLDPSFAPSFGGYLSQFQDPAVADLIRYQPDNNAVVNPGSAPTSQVNLMSDIAMESDGSYVVVGTTYGRHYINHTNANWEVYDYDLYVARYFADGTLSAVTPSNDRTRPAGRDYYTSSSGSNYPVASNNQSPLDDYGRAVAIAADGTIVVAGVWNNEIARRVLIAQYDPSSLTMRSMHLGGFAWDIRDMTIQADGKILVVGEAGFTTTGSDMALYRFNADGTTDSSFGNNGVVYANFTSYSNDSAQAVAVQPPTFSNGLVNPDSGKIIVVGYEDDTVLSSSGRVKLVVRRFNANGSIDTTFGNGGSTELEDFGTRDAFGAAVAIQPGDGRIVVLGNIDNDPFVNGADSPVVTGNFDTAVVARLNPNGTIDQTFNGGGSAGGGKVYIGAQASNSAFVGQTLHLQSDGKIMVSGLAGTPDVFGLQVVRLNSTGQFDLTYDTDGYADTTPLPTGLMSHWDYRVSMVINSEGKSVVLSNYAPGPFQFNVFQGDNRNPVASLLANDVNQVAGTYSFVVTYTDDTLIDLASIDPTSVLVFGPGFDSAGIVPGSIETNVLSNAKEIAVRYTITLPDGGWAADGSDNGLYTIRLVGNKVKDIDGTAAAARELGGFKVNIVTPDVTAPVASFDNPGTDGLWTNDLAEGITVGGRTTFRFHVVYTDPTVTGQSSGRINVSTITGNNILITGPSFYSQLARLVGVYDSNGNPDATHASQKIAIYEIDAPGGTWDISDYGTYVLTMQPHQVCDDAVAPNYISSGVIGQFSVAVTPGSDVRPGAQLVDADGNPKPTDSVELAGDNYTFWVAYEPSEDVASTVKIDLTTILGNANAVQISSTFPLFGALASPTGNYVATARGYRVEYTISPTDGRWDISDNGTYTIELHAGQIGDTDTPANFVPATVLGTFSVDIKQYVSATIVVPDSPGGTVTVTLQFTNGFVPDAGTIDAGDVTIVGPAGALPSSGTPIVLSPTQVKYIFDANALNSGSYVVTLKADEVANSGNYLAETVLGTFTFSYQPPVLMPVDTATIGIPRTASSSANTQITVVYDDDEGLDTSTFDADDLLVTRTSGGPGITLTPVGQPTWTALTGHQIAVTYTFAAPGGWWEWRDNGVWRIMVAEGEVLDLGGAAVNQAQTQYEVHVVIPEEWNAPTARATTTNIYHNPEGLTTAYGFLVTYNDDTAVDASTVLSGVDIQLISPRGQVLDAYATGLNPSNASAAAISGLYRVDHTFTSADSGRWSIRMRTHAVADVSNNSVQAGEIGFFTVQIGDDSPPVIDSVTPWVTPVAMGSGFSVTLTYSDNIALDVSTIDSGDLLVRRSDGLVLMASAEPTITPSTVNGTPRTATYTFLAPGGTWNHHDNGTYTICVRNGEILDAWGNDVAWTELGQFTFTDRAPVIGSITVAGPVAGSGNLQVTAVYTDDGAIDATTISAAEMIVERTDNGSYLCLESAGDPTVTLSADGKTATVVYSFIPPGHWWEWRDNGSYTLTVAGNSIADTGGQVAPGGDYRRTFQVNLAQDLQRPTAALVNPTTVVDPDVVSSYVFTVAYSDNAAIDLCTIDNWDIIVVSPDGETFDAELVADSLVPGGTTANSVIDNHDGTFTAVPVAATTVSAQYRINIGRTFGFGDNGEWEVIIKPNAVRDISRNAVESRDIGTFTVAIPDAVAPTAECLEIVQPKPGDTTLSVTVLYSDDTGIDSTTIGAGDITVVRTGSGQTPLASGGAPLIVPMSDGSVRVTYTFTAPGGSWNYQDIGTYRVRVNALEVRDLSGNAVDGQIMATFDFFDERPQAKVLPPLPSVANGTTPITITVEYCDDQGLDAASFDADDIVVTRTGGGSSITLVSAGAPVVQAATATTPRRVVYSFLPAGGYWDSRDNGTWSIILAAGQVRDLGGQFADGGELATFAIDLPIDAEGPVASLVSAPTLATDGATTYDFTVRYEDNIAIDVSTLGSDDVIVTDPSGNQYAAQLISFSPGANSASVLATYRITQLAGFNATLNGLYVVSVTEGAVADVSGNTLSGEIGTFRVEIVAPAVSAQLGTVAPVLEGASSVDFTVTYTSTYPIDVATLIDNDNAVRVTGPKGFAAMASYVAINLASNGLQRTVTYRLDAPGGTWDHGDNGTYNITIAINNGVMNTVGGKLAAGSIGSFNVALKAAELVGSDLLIRGTDQSDMVEVFLVENDNIRVIVNNLAAEFYRPLVQAMIIDTYGGNDTIKLNPGVPAGLIYAGSGDDTVYGSDLDDTIYGNEGNDYILANAGNDEVYGNDGADTVYGSSGNDLIYGDDEELADGDDKLHGGSGDDTIYGGVGNDTIDGMMGRDSLFGGEDNDLIYATNDDDAIDTIFAGAGTDQVAADLLDVLGDVPEILL